MLITEMYRKVGNDVITLCGHLSKPDIKEYQLQGWKKDYPCSINKHGIPVEGMKRNEHTLRDTRRTSSPR